MSEYSQCQSIQNMVIQHHWTNDENNEAYIHKFILVFWGKENLKINLEHIKACVRYFSLFSNDKCISSLFRKKYIEKKFCLQLFFLPTVSWTFILSRVTMCYPPPWNFLFRKNNCMCNWGNACDVAACPDE